MLFFHKGGDSHKSQKRFMIWLRDLFLMAIILKFLEEEIICIMAGSQLEMSFENLFINARFKFFIQDII